MRRWCGPGHQPAAIGKAQTDASRLGERSRRRRWRAAILSHMPPRPSDGPVAVAPTAITDSRLAAAQIYGELRAGELLDSAFDRRTARLDARDRRWTRELVYGSLRRRSVLDAYLNERVKGGFSRIDNDLVDLLRLGAYQ